MLCLLLNLVRAVITLPLAATCVAWFGRLLTRVLARQLQLPEALVHDSCRYLYSRVDLFERCLLAMVLARLS